MRFAISATGKLGERAIKLLRRKGEIIAVDVCRDREGQYDCRPICQKLKLPIKETKVFARLRPDFFFNIEGIHIIGRDLLDYCPCYNIHMAKLPQYRGRNVFTWAIRNGEKYQWVTLLEMTAGLDDGRIVAENKFPITMTDTARSLFRKSERLAYELLAAKLDALFSGSYKTKRQRGKPRYHPKNIGPKEINLKWPKSQIYDFVRSLDFPPYEPAYFLDNKGRKHHITLRNFNDIFEKGKRSKKID